MWPTSEVRGAWLTVLGLSFDSPGYIDEVAPKWSRFCVLDIHYFTPRTSRLSPITSHYERQPVSPSARRPVGPSLTIPHASHFERLTLPTSSVTLTASHYPLRASARRKQFLAPHTSSVGPSQQTIALANMPFSPVPKARGRGRRWIWGPCK